MHRINDIYEYPGCSVCGAVQNLVLYKRDSRTGTEINDISVTVAQCSVCGFVYNNPRVRADILSEYYLSSSLASGQVFRDEGPHGHYTSLNARRARFFFRFLEKKSCGKLLDIGCGVGGFLDALHKINTTEWQFFGLEPSKDASAQAKNKGYSVETAMLSPDVFSPSSFDAISLVSVLEHLPDLQQAVESLSFLLRPGGIVFVEVPNLLEPELSLTGFFSVEHIQHFTPNSLARLLSQHGLVEVIVDSDAEANVIRMVASRKMGGWSSASPHEFVDDRKDIILSVKKYVKKEEKMLEKLKKKVSGSFTRWKKEGRTVAIYGAGVHTVELMVHFDLQSVSSILLDGDSKKQGTLFLDIPVYAPEKIIELGVDAILVSSNRFQDEIVKKIRQVAGENVDIVLCYDK